MIGTPSTQTAICMNKETTRALLIENGIKCPKGKTLWRNYERDTSWKNELSDIEYPCVVKPTRSENSFGISLVENSDEIEEAIERAFDHDERILVDEFIQGREVRCSVIEDANSVNLIAFYPQEYHISPNSLRETNDKLQLDSSGRPLEQNSEVRTSYILRQNEPELHEALEKVVKKAHKVLQCQDFSTYDIRVDADGQPWILEVNLFSSFGSKSILVKHAIQSGWTPELLFRNMFWNQFKRYSNRH